MFANFFTANTSFNIKKLRFITMLLIVSTISSLVGYLLSNALSQIALCLLLTLYTCNFLLNSSKFLHKNSKELRISKRKTILDFLLPVFITAAVATISIGLLFQLHTIANSTISFNAMIITTAITLVTFSYSLFQLKVQNNRQLEAKKWVKRFFLLIAPVILTLSSALLIKLTNNTTIEYAATSIMLFYIFVFAIKNLYLATASLTLNTSEKLDLLELEADLNSFEYIQAVHSIQAWLITDNLFGVKCEVSLKNTNSPHVFIIDEVTDFLLQNYQIEHISFHVINQSIEGTFE